MAPDPTGGIDAGMTMRRAEHRREDARIVADRATEKFIA
jgi:hypothetical protein